MHRNRLVTCLITMKSIFWDVIPCSRFLPTLHIFLLDLLFILEVCLSETSVNLYRTTRPLLTEHSTLHKHHKRELQTEQSVSRLTFEPSTPKMQVRALPLHQPVIFAVQNGAPDRNHVPHVLFYMRIRRCYYLAVMRSFVHLSWRTQNENNITKRQCKQILSEILGVQVFIIFLTQIII
jgi:hypothetical protein